MSRHLHRHQGIKLFNCSFPECLKSFVDKASVGIHLVSHCNDKDYACDATVCGKRYKRLRELAAHRQAKHSNETGHKCEFDGCDKVFPYDNQEKEFHCSYDGYIMIFYRSDHLKLHRRVHSVWDFLASIVSKNTVQSEIVKCLNSFSKIWTWTQYVSLVLYRSGFIF